MVTIFFKSARNEADSLALKQCVHLIWFLSCLEIYWKKKKKKASYHERFHVIPAELQHLSNAHAERMWQAVNLSDFVSVARLLETFRVHLIHFLSLWASTFFKHPVWMHSGSIWTFLVLPFFSSGIKYSLMDALDSVLSLVISSWGLNSCFSISYPNLLTVSLNMTAPVAETFGLCCMVVIGLWVTLLH